MRKKNLWTTLRVVLDRRRGGGGGPTIGVDRGVCRGRPDDGIPRRFRSQLNQDERQCAVKADSMDRRAARYVAACRLAGNRRLGGTYSVPISDLFLSSGLYDAEFIR